MIRKSIVPDIDTECIHIPPSCAEKEEDATHVKHVIFIPGNPGCLHFYTTWLPSLHKAMETFFSQEGNCRTAVHVHGFSQPNHHFNFDKNDLKNMKEDKYFEKFDLSFQVKHATAFVRSIMNSYCEQNAIVNLKRCRQNHSICLVSHSLGAYVALDLLDDQYNRDIRDMTNQCILLMPFILYSDIGCFEKSFFYILNYLRGGLRVLLTRAVEVFKCLPAYFCQNAFSLFFPGHTREYINAAAAGMVSKRLLLNVLHVTECEVDVVPVNERRMLATLDSLSVEFNGEDCEVAGKSGTINIAEGIVGEDVDGSTGSMCGGSGSRSTGVRVMALYTNNDIFAPLSSCRRFFLSFPRITTRYIPGLSHGFSTVHESCAKVNSAIMQFVSFSSLLSLSTEEHSSCVRQMRVDRAVRAGTVVVVTVMSVILFHRSRWHWTARV